MNPEIKIRYENDLPVTIAAAHVTNCSMHSHPDTVEIIYVLKGTVDVKVSFENFALKAGDFVIVNYEDFHYINGKGKDNAVLSFFIDLSYLEKLIKHIRYITFACESFTIQDSRTEAVDLIRNLIQKAVADLILRREGYKTAVSDTAFQIITILVDHFTILQYYLNERKLSSQKLEKYYRIMKKLDEEYQNKTLIEDISKSEFYSKYYLAHLYKGLMLMSIQDSLSATRCFKSEILLLTTDKSIQEISMECGFSDTKYYYKHFHKWYNNTPAQYRKLYQAEIYKENITEEIATDELLKMMSGPLPTMGQEAGSSGREAEGTGLFNFAMVYLFEKGRIVDAGQKDSAVVNWDAVDETVRRIGGIGLKPYVAMNFNARAVDDWLNILKECCSLYEAEICGWEFCFFYTEADQKERLRELISAVKESCPGIRIKVIIVLKEE